MYKMGTSDRIDLLEMNGNTSGKFNLLPGNPGFMQSDLVFITEGCDKQALNVTVTHFGSISHCPSGISMSSDNRLPL